jgi:hypothetical protein
MPTRCPLPAARSPTPGLALPGGWAGESSSLTLELEPGRAYRVRGVVSPDPIELEGIQVTATSQNWLVGAALRSVFTVERRLCLRNTRDPMLIVE